MKDKNPKAILDYIGSKTKLAPIIAAEIENHFGVVDGASLFDVFAGTAAVSRWFLHNRKLGTITTNDFEIYSTYTCIATMKHINIHQDYYDHLNNISGEHGFVTEHCSNAGKMNRMFFTEHNAKKIDAMKRGISEKLNNGKITTDLAILAMKLAGELTIAADKVSNTASVYGAFLKKFKRTALNKIVIEPLQPAVKSKTKVWNLCENANYIIDQIKGDILYIDPPYTSRQYGNNYHVLNYIADINAEYKYKPYGVTGIHKNWQRSKFCNKKKVAEQLDDLLYKADFEFITMSYSNKGILPLITLKTILNQYGKILNIKTVEYNGFRADRNRKYDPDKIKEYIITLRKTKKPI